MAQKAAYSHKRVVGCPWLSYLVTMLSLLPLTTTSEGVSTTFIMVVAVFSPDDTGWEEAINLATEEMQREDMEVQFFYFRHNYELSLPNSRIVKGIMKSNGVSAIIGPYDPLLELVADDNKIPYITTTTPPDMTIVRRPRFCYHLMPSVSILNDVVLALIKAYAWGHSAVFYNKPEGLKLIGELMTMSNLEVNAWKIENGANSSELLDHLLRARRADMRTFLVVCDRDTINHILEVALRLSMMSKRYHWLVLNMDSHCIDYEEYSYTMVNFSIFQLYTENFVSSLNRTSAVTERKLSETLIDRNINVLQYAASVDAVNLVMNATRALTMNATQCPPFCNTTHNIRGLELNPYIHSTDYFGETGLISFDSENYRRQVTLNIMWLAEEGLRHHGNWCQNAEPGEHLQIRPFLREVRNEPNILGRDRVRIVTIIDPPFVMKTEDSDKQTGNDRFEGYLIDLIAEIGKRLDFEYILYESPDGNYGSRNQETDEWNGMIQELILGKAAMCLGAISITSEREQVVDFTKPYKQKMFNFLMKKPDRKSSIFQFLWPLSTHVWLLTISSMIIVGFLLFLMDYFCPNSDDKTVGRFNLKESIWFIYGSLVGVGTEMVPRTISGRLLSGAWWFFGLILVSSYTANLAAFLTVTKIETPIKSVADLAGQTKIKYGTVKNSYGNSMFRSSKLEIFKKMWTFMDKIHPDSMVDNFSVGVKKVKDEDYVFIWDKPITDYIALHDCETIATGTAFDEKGYGIGVPMGAAYRDQITLEILGLGEAGFMQQLEEKWWSGGQCEQFSDTSTSGTKELQLDNVAGVFVVVAMGALLGCIACFLEIIWRKTRKTKKVPPLDGDSNGIDRDGSSVALKNSMFHNNHQDYYFSYGRKESSL